MSTESVLWHEHGCSNSRFSNEKLEDILQLDVGSLSFAQLILARNWLYDSQQQFRDNPQVFYV